MPSGVDVEGDVFVSGADVEGTGFGSGTGLEGAGLVSAGEVLVFISAGLSSTFGASFVSLGTALVGALVSIGA